MKHTFFALAAWAACVVLAAAPKPTRAAPPADGFQAQSANKDFRAKFGGRTQVDAGAFSAATGPNRLPNQGGLAPELADTVDLRRARFRVEGRAYELYDWACEYDFVNQINVHIERYPTERDSGPLTAVTDLWLQMRELPILGTLRGGNQKDAYGYAHLTNSRWLNFMERSFSKDAFEGPFNIGFLPGSQSMNSSEDGTVGRIVWLPVFEDEGRKLIHLGLSGRTTEPRRTYTAFDPVTGLPVGDQINAVRFRSRGSLRNGPSSSTPPVRTAAAPSTASARGWPSTSDDLPAETATMRIIIPAGLAGLALAICLECSRAAECREQRSCAAVPKHGVKMVPAQPQDRADSGCCWWNPLFLLFGHGGH